MPRTGFDARIHGFAFRNSFELGRGDRAVLVTGLATAIDGALGALGPFGVAARVAGVRVKLAQLLVSGVPESYGLCGGMAFAALDYFRSGVPVPRGNGPDDQPPVGSQLRVYLWDRLLLSWALNGAVFLEWIARLHWLPARWPFDAGPRALRDRSRKAWSALQRSVDAGEPVPLGLVGESGDPFRDHQVLATGYERTSNLAGTIYVYDMNCPGAEQTIKFDLGSDILISEESCARAGNPLRGFFCEAYTQATPPR